MREELEDHAENELSMLGRVESPWKSLVMCGQTEVVNTSEILNANEDISRKPACWD